MALNSSQLFDLGAVCSNLALAIWICFKDMNNLYVPNIRCAPKMSTQKQQQKKKPS